MSKVIFLDRDGTINTEVNYLHRPEDLIIYPEAVEGLRMLKKAGFRIVVVTNQAGVARGYYGEEDVKKLHAYMNEQLAKEQAAIDAFFYCPHHPEHGIGAYRAVCHCRKPETGMFEQAQEQFEINKAHSYMIGDKLIDIQAGHNFGIQGILVGTGYGQEIHDQLILRDGETLTSYDHFSPDLVEAALWILERERSFDL